jgi:signal transduction histidine kinase
LSLLVLTAVRSFAAAWLFGAATRTARVNARLLAEQARLRADAVLTPERLAIARDLHDVVAHHMGLAVVRAEAYTTGAARPGCPATVDQYRLVQLITGAIFVSVVRDSRPR